MKPVARTLLALALAWCALPGQELIPVPAQVRRSEGHFLLGQATRIVASGEARAVGERLQGYLKPATGLPLPLVPRGGKGDIRLVLDPKAAACGEEGYRLASSPEGVEIRALKPAGLFYGVQTLRQLLPKEIFREAPVAGANWALPAVAVEDAPRFAWRGSHLDVCRHFMPKSFLKRHLDLMALHKLNVFHWHLTDDQGWRIEIRKYPRLTEAGAWRRETILPESMRVDRASQKRFDGIPHGGFYTQEDVREIVRYAADRFITVVPEIEMPGHSTAALVAYPEFGNFPGQKLEVVREWGVFESVFSVEDRTLAFLKDVLDEVVALFPSKFIHIGGDECPKAEWARSEGALHRMKQIGLVAPETTLAELQAHRNAEGRPAEHPALHRLQSWFVKQMDAHLAARGRRLLGWDEILEGGSISAGPQSGREHPAGQSAAGGLAPGAAIMSWRGEAGGILAAQAGHDVVMAPNTPTYLDHYQSEGAEPFTIGGLSTLAMVYAYEPVPAALSASEARHVLGAQGQLWTEYMSGPSKVEYMAWPRLTALAEVLWSPKKARDFPGFQTRLKTHLGRLDALDVAYRPLEGARSFPR